jgi:hypothetical protein
MYQGYELTLQVVGVENLHNISKHGLCSINVLPVYKMMILRYCIDVPAQGKTGTLKPKTSLYCSVMMYDTLSGRREDWTDSNIHSCKPPLIPVI